MSRTTSIGRPRRSSTSSTKTAAGGSGKSRRSTSAGTPTEARSPGRISSHRNWLVLARKLAGRYRRTNVRRRSGPLVLTSIGRLLLWLHKSRRLTVLLSLRGERGLVSRPGRGIAASSAMTRFPAATILQRRADRRTPPRACLGSSSRPSAEGSKASRKKWIVTNVVTPRTSTVERSVPSRYAPSDSSIAVPLTVAAEATRFGRRTRHRRSRTEEKRTGVTTTVIERATGFHSHFEKVATSPEELRSFVPESIPGAWETRSPQTIDVSRLTDEVLTQIDRRVVARRERFGRI